MTVLRVVSIVVSDMTRSIDFYSRLGLELAEGGPGDAHASFLGEGVRVMLDTEDLIKQLHPGWSRPTGGPAMTLAFECRTPAAVDAMHEALIQAGSSSVQQPWDAFWNQRYAAVTDPDGNPVDLFAELP